ncbi:porin [Mastigocoleus testarum BC008]|uniref:Porin n=1 Tax=Mastigocoleus testarum BC008 TaxID=371196 RepID=A0A0V7ZIJ9_9CYAN|nr:porin [Mastigocoleus testarum BC008]KST64400.1 porin [Mastigocoleus testarum BC008]
MNSHNKTIRRLIVLGSVLTGGVISNCSVSRASIVVQNTLPPEQIADTATAGELLTGKDIPHSEISPPEKDLSLLQTEFSSTTSAITTTATDAPEKLEKQFSSPIDRAYPPPHNSAGLSFPSDKANNSNEVNNLGVKTEIKSQITPGNERIPKTNQPSVSGLSDVYPTDWAYQALKSLVERYQVISGYPDGTFRGKRPLTRYEFAEILSATVDKMESVVADLTGQDYVRQDMIILRRLRLEYRAALDGLSRIEKISDSIDRLEGNQFSTTTKLSGEQIFGLTGGSGANGILLSRSRVNLRTSFRPNDLLITQFEAGSDSQDAIGLKQEENGNLLGTSGFIANGGGLDYADVESNFRLRRLYYTLRPTSDLAVTLGAKMSPRDFIDRNSYANNEAVDFSSSFFLNNPLIVQNQIDRNGGAGAAISWNPGGGKFTLRSLYIAGNSSEPDSDSDGGLFGDPRQSSVELEYVPSKQLTIRLQYTNASINNIDIEAFGVNAEYSLNYNTGIFARLGFGKYQGFSTVTNTDLDLNPVSWAIGVGFRNIVIPGTIAGIAIGQPFATNGLGDANQINLEAFYNLQLSDNISVTPTFTFVDNADNDSSNSIIWQSTLRTVISF